MSKARTLSVFSALVALSCGGSPTAECTLGSGLYHVTYVKELGAADCIRIDKTYDATHDATVADPGCSIQRTPSTNLCSLVTEEDCLLSLGGRVVTKRTITWTSGGAAGSGKLQVSTTVNGTTTNCSYTATYSR
jgi:hypothetical protein